MTLLCDAVIVHGFFYEKMDIKGEMA